MARPVRDPSETLELPDDEPTSITIRPATPADGRTMWHLAKDSGSLDLNSPYAYLLAGHHFGATTKVAVDTRGGIAGFVIGYRPPAAPHQVFVWQVAVDPSHRGSGVGHKLLGAVVDDAIAAGAHELTATVTPSNEASRRLFQSVARARSAEFREQPCFDTDLFPGEGHEPENEIVIGPLA
jgi:L-2,4-diaminobutyric acid acetyltransferase